MHRAELALERIENLTSDFEYEQELRQYVHLVEYAAVPVCLAEAHAHLINSTNYILKSWETPDPELALVWITKAEIEMDLWYEKSGNVLEQYDIK